MRTFIIEHAVCVKNGQVVTGKCHIADSSSTKKKEEHKKK